MSQIAEDFRLDTEPVGRKLSQVTEAGRRLFLDQGFAATSMDAIAREATVSKATLYSYFPSKEALFAHLIADECMAIHEALEVPSIEEGFELALRRFAEQYVQFFIDRKRYSMCRVMANESSRFPDLCWQFYETGPLATLRRVAQLLLDARELGLISFIDPMICATQFLSLIRGDLPLRVMLGIRYPAETIENEIDAGLRTFMTAFRVA